MMKKFLSGMLVTALVLGSVAVAAPEKAEAVSVPKAKYTFNMNGKSKNVVAVGRKGDNASLATGGKAVLPTEAQAKAIKGTLKYAKGKHGKALYIDRTKSVGAQLKGVNLGSGSFTLSFWVKVPNGMSNFTSAFFRTSDVSDKSAKWLSITRRADIADIGGSPVIWSRNVKNGEFPWYNKNGVDKKTKEAKWVWGDSLAEAKSWTHITLVVDTKAKKVEYGKKGEDGYTKGPHAYTYVNGALYGNGTIANGILSSKDKFFLGINAWDTPMKAYYDDVQLWDKALTAKQVKALYKSQK